MTDTTGNKKSTTEVVTEILGDVLQAVTPYGNLVPLIVGIFQRHGVTPEQLATVAANNANAHLVRDAVIAAGGTWPDDETTATPAPSDGGRTADLGAYDTQLEAEPDAAHYVNGDHVLHSDQLSRWMVIPADRSPVFGAGDWTHKYDITK